MKSGRLQPIYIQRGLYWRGFMMDCYADAAETTLRDLTGWQPFMDVRAFITGPVLFSFSVSLGDTPGRLIVHPMTGTQTAALPAGVLQTSLAFRNPDGHALGTYAAGEVHVVDAITIPPAA